MFTLSRVIVAAGELRKKNITMTFFNMIVSIIVGEGVE